MLEITDEDFEKEVLQADVPVVVDFYASWCSPCKMLMPTIEALATELDGKVKVVKINVATHTKYASKYGVSSVPTLVAFQDGKEYARMVGGASRETIKTNLGI